MSSAASKRPTMRTASTCSAAEAARLTHSFKVVGSTLHRGFGLGRCVCSATFAAGGHRWRIKYYPDGHTFRDYAGVFLELMSETAPATALFDFRLVNQATGLSSHVCSHQTAFKTVNSTWGSADCAVFFKKADLDAQGYLRDDCLEIECDLTVIEVDEIDVQPPSDLRDSLGKLLESEEGADVTFKVKEDAFRAHRIVLATRSPVFKAQLYGPMSNRRMRNFTVEDMEPPVFKALLQFIYTDSLPAMDDLDDRECEDMAKHLLVAADRYGMERMRLVCESILCRRLAAWSVASTLVLADRYHCIKLQDACVRFINSSHGVMADVVASKGYEDLKAACPALALEISEKSAKYRKVKLVEHSQCG